jgi:hypothetical protein
MTSNESNYPSEWKNFCSVAGNTGAEFFGFTKPLPEVNRFAARYRAANSFRGLELDGYSSNTTAGYSGLCRVLFVYSAFEAFMKITGHSQTTIGHELEEHGAIRLLSRLKTVDSGNQFYRFIFERVNPVHQTQLQNYFNDDPCNVAFLASSIRHIFAHGFLTPSAGGGEAVDATEICNLVSEFLLAFMDAEFTKRVSKGMDEIFG